MEHIKKQFDWIRELIGENFLAVYDVVLDIQQELQLSADVVIPIFQPIVKFKVLMPGDGINMRDRYCNFRWKATEFLKSKGVIKDFKLLQGSHRWEGRLRITVEQIDLNKVVEIMAEDYKRRSQSNKIDDQSAVVAPISNNILPLEKVCQLIERFHSVVTQLRHRHQSRPTLDVSDEYDVQDLLHALLNVYFDDVRPEEWTPSYAGKSARVDFLLKPEKIVIECKKTRAGLGVREIGDELILDIERYSKMPDCKTLVCMIYDPENRILNPGGLQSDLSRQRNSLHIEVIVVPKLY